MRRMWKSILVLKAPVINSDAIKFYENLGVDRIVLGRELNLDEIKAN